MKWYKEISVSNSSWIARHKDVFGITYGWQKKVSYVPLGLVWAIYKVEDNKVWVYNLIDNNGWIRVNDKGLIEPVVNRSPYYWRKIEITEEEAKGFIMMAYI